MINTTVQLTRGENGRLRPSQPEPRTHAEAREYIDQKAMADLANNVLDGINQDVSDMITLDNGSTDLNSAKGTVVLGPVNAGETSRDRLLLERSAEVDTATGQVKAFDAKTSGTMAYEGIRSAGGLNVLEELRSGVLEGLFPEPLFDSTTTSLWLNPIFHNLGNFLFPSKSDEAQMDSSISYQAGPLLNIEHSEIRQKSGTSRKSEQTFLLQETAPGDFTLDFHFVDNLGLVRA